MFFWSKLFSALGFLTRTFFLTFIFFLSLLVSALFTKVFILFPSSKPLTLVTLPVFRQASTLTRNFVRRLTYKCEHDKNVKNSCHITLLHCFVSSVRSSIVHHGLLHTYKASFPNFFKFRAILPLYIYNSLLLSFSVQYTVKNQAKPLHELH